MNTSEQDKPTLPDGGVDKIKEHYNHAIEKHSHFADRLFVEDSDDKASDFLTSMRRCLYNEKRDGNVTAETIVVCELAEAAEAFARGDKSHAVEELYDTIAVLLRIVDVIEGRQKLGKKGDGK